MEYFVYDGAVVLRINARAVAGESEGTYNPATDLTHDMVAEFYICEAGKLVPKSQTEVDALQAQIDKDAALVTMTRDIESRMVTENDKPFPYGGNVYTSDQGNIQATQNQCLTMDPELPILTMIGTAYEGTWPSDNGPIAFNCGEFIEFATAFFVRGSDNFTTRSGHIYNVTAIYDDPTATAADILAYDYSGGWS